MHPAKRRRGCDLRVLAGRVAALLLIAPAAAAAAGAPYTGTITGPDGKPLAGAEVALFEPLAPWREMTAILAGEPLPAFDSTRTTDDGRFTLAAPAGVWRLEVSAVGLAPRSTVVPLTGEPAEHGTVSLSRDEGLEVTVFDPAGRPVEGARLAVLTIDVEELLEGRMSFQIQRAQTDGAGKARASRPPGMPVGMAVAAPGLAPAMLELGPGETENVVRLAEGEPWTVEVRDGLRQPVAGAVIATDTPHVPLAVTGDDGRATLRLPQGDPQALVVATEAGTAWLVLEPSPPPAGDDRSPPHSAIVTLGPPAALAGRVVDAGDRRPLAGALVWHQMRPDLRAVTGPDGTFSLPVEESVEFDDVWLVAAAAAGHRSEGLPLTIDSEAVEIPLSPVTGVSGRVVGEDGEPIAGATLVAVPSSLFGLGSADHAWSGADGGFVFRRLEPEKMHEVTITHPELPDTKTGVTAPAAGVVAPEVRITLARGSRVLGRVHAADGRPLPSAEARLVWVDRRRDEGLEAPRALTGDDGRFTIERVLPGTYDLQVTGAGHAPLRLVEVEVPKPPAERDVGRLDLHPGAQIAGRVVDDEGRPVAGASILRAVDFTSLLSGLLSGRAEVEELATSGAEGGFVISDLEPGSALDLVVQAAGFLPVSLAGVPAPPESPLRVVLARAAAVAGQVVDAEGDGVAGAMVIISNGESGNLGMTGPDGSFDVAGLPPGEVRLQVGAGSASPPDPMVLELQPGERREGVRIEVERASGEIEGGPGELLPDVELAKGHRVAGQVVDAGGTPVAEARVELRHPVARAAPEPATTSPDGRFELTGIAPGEWLLLASKRGYVRAERPLAVEGSIDGVELRLGEGAAIAGEVRGLDTADLSRLHVFAMSPGLGRHRGEVDASGAYRIGGLPPAAWHVTAELEPGEGTAGGTIAVTGEEEARLDLDFGGLVLRGRVTLAGSPVGGAYVTWAGLDAPVEGRLLTDADGRFRLARLSPGRYRLDIDGTLPEVVHRLEVDLDGDREVSIEVSAGEVSGRAVDADSGAPIAGAKIRLWGEGARYGTGSRIAVTGRDGTFRAARVAAGRYRLLAEKEGHAKGHVELDVAPGEAVAGIEVALRRSVGAVLVVSSPHGTPSRVTAAAVPAGSPPPPPDRPLPALANRWEVPTEDGRVELPALPAGRWRVHVSATNLAATAVEVLVPGPPVPVALAPQAVLDVRVPELYRSGLPARVRLLAADGQPLVLPEYGDVLQAAWPLQFGRKQLWNVPPGSWAVQVTAEDGRVWTRTVTVPAGAATEVLLEP